MHVGIAFDLKPAAPLPADAPDDLYEEFDAPVTIHAIADVLTSLGHSVSLLHDGRPLLETLLRNKPDFVFNFAEGTGVGRSREARVPAVCEMLDIPYTGSDPLALAVALDKGLTRRIVQTADVVVPKGLTLKFDAAPYDGDFSEFPAMLEASELPLPVIAKPTFEGSSKGVRNRCLIRTPEEFGPTVMKLWEDYRQPVLVEEFIAGTEVTVGVLGNDPPQVFGLMSITPKEATEHFVYSLEVKRDYKQQVDYASPPALPVPVLRAVEAAALMVFDVLGCRDVARLDFRVRDGVPYFIEINPLPGLNPESSDLVILAGLIGVSHADLITRIVNAAMTRAGLA
ncbi:D-alanine--D-alanine ligase family protein [Limnoglobus roseus]|uniref:D-alanine--D-alanine ligase n=1 Tax=Limnoglobus roseus TaxID=2598579 RepID=A0A5C1AEN7_9BACT|nr:D-alanine--D-alanine ligase [Limnoglobus roseus]QEL16152.1 D-alanine--D-alanine ligase [Limnoglobus roseus]